MNKMKKILALALLAVSLFAVALPAMAADWTWHYGSEVDGNSGSSSNVRAVQNDLNAWRQANGYAKIGVDGYWGPETEAAVRLFQRLTPGLSEDGVVGPNTMRELYKWCPHK